MCPLPLVQVCSGFLLAPKPTSRCYMNSDVILYSDQNVLFLYLFRMLAHKVTRTQEFHFCTLVEQLIVQENSSFKLYQLV
jgi:hypothetical protein